MMKRTALRPLWVKLHLWLGLGLGSVLVLLGLTGSALVFYPRLDALLAADVMTVTPGSATRPADEVLAAAQASYAGVAQPTWILLPKLENGAWIIRYDEPLAGGDMAPVWYAMDPFTARPLGERIWGEYAMSWLYELHHSLHLGDHGETAVGVVGVLFALSLVSGLYLWWPMLRANVRNALTLKRNTTSARRDRDLHNVAGAYGGLVLLVIALSGATLVFMGPVTAVVSKVADTTPYPAVASTPLPGARDVGVDRAVAAAQAVFPDGTLRYVALPQDTAAAYLLFMHQPGEWGANGAQSLVWVDRWSGAVLATRDWHALTTADRLLAAADPLHNGDAFGLVGRWLVVLAGFLPLVFFVTGIRMYLRRRAGRKRRSARLAGDAQANAQRRQAVAA